MSKMSSEILDNPKEGGRKKKKVENNGGDSSLLIPHLDRDSSIHCLLRLSRSEYGLIAALNQSFRSLIKDGELYQHRRKMGIIEHWVYFRYDTDKESLAVGTELHVFVRELTSLAIYKYSFLINSWSKGMKMKTPRCVFGSASLGEIAILVGGCDQHGNIFSSSELYNSDTGMWEILPDMNTARRTCSAVFMDGKFYVLGGVGVDNKTRLTCGEEFDLETIMWRKIPKMCPPQNADYAQKLVKRYVKDKNSWVTIGSLPDRVTSVNGWGIGFRSCGDKLVVIGGSFVHNCAVMGC
ncbi:hypothetical protein P8452_13260 [Trifolium repens]|nr:hypothetical protein P8452_13260 [Trifolium repens]